MTLRILVVDDHPLFRDGVSGLLSSVADTDVVAVAGTAEEAVREATLSRPDVVLMDLNLPGTSGVEATRRIAATLPETAVLVLTMLEDDASIVAAMQAGARGYVLKGASQEELLAAVRTVAQGGAVFSGGVAARVLGALTETRPQADHRHPVHPDLTDRETDVLRLLADGWSNPRIAHELGLSAKTVQNHVSRILTKLRARDRVELVLRMRDEAE